MYNLDDILKFISEKTGGDEVTEITDIERDLGCYGDDFHEMISEYSKKFNVDIESYLWYFHTREEGNSIGGLFFEAPNEQVKLMPITPIMLLDFANKGKWNLEYPAHKISKKRPDLLINALLIMLLAAFLVYYHFIR
jgi:coproporphyrinogen III oxidase